MMPSLLLFLAVMALVLALPFLFSFLAAHATENETAPSTIRPFSAFLRICVATLGAFFVPFAFMKADLLFAVGLLSFFGVAFSVVSFSGIDQTATQPMARKWFLVTLVFGVIGLAVLLASIVVALKEANYSKALKLSGSLPLLIFVWLKHGRAVVATISRKPR